MFRARVAIASLLAICASGLALAPADAAPLPLTQVFCGQTIITPIRVANNLTGCPASGLNIGASGVTVDMNGHRFDGTGNASNDGIDDSGGFDHVTVKNGVLSNFTYGLFARSGDHSAFTNLVITTSAAVGLVIDDMTNSHIDRNVITGSVTKGVLFQNSATSNVFQNNTVVANTTQGVAFDSSAQDNLVRRNIIASNSDVGIETLDAGATGNRFVENRIYDNNGAGVYLGSNSNRLVSNKIIGNDIGGVVGNTVSSTVLDRNRITGNGSGGAVFVLGSGNTLTNNVVSANDGNGIQIAASVDAKILDNVANENGQVGILSDSLPLTLKRNHADRNGYFNGSSKNSLGIDVPAGSVNAANTAKDNSDGHQCGASDVNCYHATPVGTAPTLIHCGDTVPMVNAVMNNVHGCTADGLIVGVANTTIDLRGHRIAGEDNTKFFKGIKDDLNVNPGLNNAVVRNGVITNFSEAVDYNHMTGGSITGIHATVNGNHGIFLEQALHVTVIGNWSSRTVNAGILLENSTDGLVSSNHVFANHNQGIELTQFNNRTKIVRNTASGNGAGIVIAKSAGAKALHNRSVGNSFIGMEVTEGDHNTVIGNLSRGNSDQGFYWGDLQSNSRFERNHAIGNKKNGALIDDTRKNRFVHNTFNANTLDGVKVQGGTPTLPNVFISNTSNENGGHGLESDSTIMSVVRQVANRNGFIAGLGSAGDTVGLGIFVPAGTMNHGNHAKGNDDPNECEASDVNCFVP